MRSYALLTGLFLFALSSVSAQSWWKDGMRGEGITVKKDMDLPAFDAVKLNIPADVYLTQGTTQSVTIEAQSNIIENIITEVNDRAWVIRYDRPVRRSDKVKIYITIPDLTRIAVSGSGSMTTENTFTGLEDLEATVSGSGDIRLAIEAQALDTQISGSGSIALRGAAKKMGVRISGSGNLRAADLNVDNCVVRISGSGDCDVEVKEELEVRVSGSGDVTYGGSPRVRSKISGSGDVRSRG